MFDPSVTPAQEAPSPPASEPSGVPAEAVPFIGNAELKARLDAPGKLTVAGEPLHADLLRRFYLANGYQTEWGARPVAAERLRELVLLHAQDHGLDPALFHGAALGERGPALSPLDRDLLLSDAFLAYADALARGVLQIEERLDDEDLTPEPVDVVAVLPGGRAQSDPGATQNGGRSTGQLDEALARWGRRLARERLFVLAPRGLSLALSLCALIALGFAVSGSMLNLPVALCLSLPPLVALAVVLASSLRDPTRREVARVFDRDLSADPVTWVGKQLSDLSALLTRGGVDVDESFAADAQNLRDRVPEIMTAVQGLLDDVKAGKLGTAPAGDEPESARISWL